MAKANSKKNLSKKVNNLLKNCTIEQIEVEDYIEKLMECGFMSPQAVQQRKETTNHLRYWFVVYIPKLYSHLAFYQTTSETAFKVKTKSKDIYELPENISSLLLHSGERKPIHRFVDISRGIFIPGDVFAPANVQNDKQDFAYWQQEQLKEVASDLESVIPFHNEAEDTYKIFTKELFQSSRKVWYEKRLADGSVVSTSYYYPKLIYCLQFIFRARNLEFVRNQLKMINSSEDAEVRQTNLKKVENFLKEVQQIYDRCVTTLYKTMYMITKMNESALAKAEEVRDMIRQRVTQGCVPKTQNGKLYFVNDKNEVVDEYPEIFMIYYRILSSADALAKNIQKLYDQHAKEDAKNIAMPFTRYSTYDAQWMDLFSKVIHKQDNLNNADASELKKNIALEDAFSALQSAQEVEEERLKSERLALQKEEAAQQKQRAFVLSLEQSKKNLENFICKQFIPTVLEYRNVKDTLRTNKLLNEQDFAKQVENKFASNEGLNSIMVESANFDKGSAYDAELIQSLYEDLKAYDERYEESVTNGKLQQFISSIKTTGVAQNDTQSQEYVQIQKFIARAEEGVLTYMTQAVEDMQQYIAVAKACLDRFKIATRYAEARDVLWNLEKEKKNTRQLISLLPVCSSAMLSQFDVEWASVAKTIDQFVAKSELDMQKLYAYEEQMKNMMHTYISYAQQVTKLYETANHFDEEIDTILKTQKNKLITSIQQMCCREELSPESKEAYVDGIKLVFEVVEEMIQKLELEVNWDTIKDFHRSPEKILGQYEEYKQMIQEKVISITKGLCALFEVALQEKDNTNHLSLLQSKSVIQEIFDKTKEEVVEDRGGVMLETGNFQKQISNTSPNRAFDEEADIMHKLLHKIKEVAGDKEIEILSITRVFFDVVKHIDEIEKRIDEKYQTKSTEVAPLSKYLNDIADVLKEKTIFLQKEDKKHKEMIDILIKAVQEANIDLFNAYTHYFKSGAILKPNKK